MSIRASRVMWLTALRMAPLAKLTTFKPRLRTVDTRTVRPPPKTADHELQTPEHRAWRLVVCRRAGWRCQWVDNGKRCEASAARGDRMIADHIIEREDGGALHDAANGQCLCTQHNTRKGIQARAARR